MAKNVKAWAVVSSRGRIEYVASDDWNFHYGLFPRKYQALEEAKRTNGSYKVVPVMITFTP